MSRRPTVRELICQLTHAATVNDWQRFDSIRQIVDFRLSHPEQTTRHDMWGYPAR
jgi:hypothetical protein